MNRNNDRLGTQNPASDTPPQQAAGGSGGFSFVVPTEFVDLPSNGNHYPEGHALYGQGTIEIKQMTAKEEDILTSRSLLRKGVALDRVIQSIIVNKTIDASTLLIGDRNAIVIAARISGYGQDYSTTVNCPSCGESQSHTFDLSEIEPYQGSEEIDKLGATDNNNGTFDVVLPKTELNITLRLLTGKDENALAAAFLGNKKKKDIEHNVTTQLSNIIVAVNGDSSKEALKYVSENLPSLDSRYLRMAYRVLAPNVDLSCDFECASCDYEQGMEVPLNADFFWPEQ